ncbi:MAG: amidase [Ardenticatenaceae bacterium]|nr:amidase [Ardenticatenaceae bacterium]
MQPKQDMDRRSFLQLSLAGAAGVSARALPGDGVLYGGGHHSPRVPYSWLEEITIGELQYLMDAGKLTARKLVRQYLRRIHALDIRGPKLRSVMELNPDALYIAKELDRERRKQGPRGPLHGIPILIKDNIGTADEMETTAGSLSLVGHPPTEDATVAAKLREAGAIILGKTTLSEWANFRSFQSSSGWSGRGGQCKNPYVLDRNPCGSSSGSGAAAAANLAVATLGTETDGSIVCPATANGVVGIKPTVGLTSRFNVIPISDTQDTIGPLARTVTDAAIVLGALTGVDPNDAATAKSAGQSYTDYTQFLDAGALNGARIGIPRGLFFFSPETDDVFAGALTALQNAGATLVDPVDVPAEVAGGNAELEVLLFEFKDGVNKYLSRLGPGAPQTLADLIAFNNANADSELKFFGQELFDLAEAKGPLTSQEYLDFLAASVQPAVEWFDTVMDGLNLDAMVAPTGSPAWPIDLINGDHFLGGTSSPAARAGYPLVSVPAGFSFGLPVNISFMGRAFSEPTLIALAYAFEQATMVRTSPSFIPTLSFS